MANRAALRYQPLSRFSETLNVLQHFLAALIALGRIFRHRPRNDAIESLGQLSMRSVAGIGSRFTTLNETVIALLP